MSAMTNLLPVVAAPVTRTAPARSTANDTANRPATDPADGSRSTDRTAKTRDQSAAEPAQDGASDSEPTVAFADIYEEELQDQGAASTGETPVIVPDVTSAPPPPVSTLPVADSTLTGPQIPAHWLSGDSGNPLPLPGEALPLPPTLASEVDDLLLLTPAVMRGVSAGGLSAEEPIQLTTRPLESNSAPQSAIASLADAGTMAPLITPSESGMASTAATESHITPIAPSRPQAASASVVTSHQMVDGEPSVVSDRPSDTGRGSAVPPSITAAALGGETAQRASSEALEQSVTAASVRSSTGGITGQPPVSTDNSPVQMENSVVKSIDSPEPAPGPAIPDQAQETVWHSQVADRVRAWRGLTGTEPAANLTTDSAAGSSNSHFGQSRQDSAGGGIQSGQLQQFADALRIAVNNPAPVGLTETAGVAGAASSAGTADAAGVWRGESGAPAAQPAQGRTSPAPTFAQTMQASSFGQPLGQSVGENGWSESLSQRVTLMAGQKVSSARIELDPPELGAMTVKITISGDQASVNFASPNAVVRDALEQTFPRLQDLLGQQGLQLADANVSDNSARGRQSGDSGNGTRQQGTAQEGDSDVGATSHTVKAPLGLIDFYA